MWFSRISKLERSKACKNLWARIFCKIAICLQESFWKSASESICPSATCILYCIQKKKKKGKRKRQNYFGGLDIANHNDIYIYMFIYFQFTSTLINVCLFGSKQLSFCVLICLFIKYFEYLVCVRHWVMYRRLRDEPDCPCPQGSSGVVGKTEISVANGMQDVVGIML